MKNATTIRNDEDARAYLISTGRQAALDTYLRTRESDGALLISIPNPCCRCGGSGRGPWRQDGGICYDCGGTDTRGRRRTFTLKAYAQSAKRTDTARAKKVAARQAELDRCKAEAAAFRAASPELDAALKLEGNALLADLAARLEQYGFLSDAQVKLALKVAGELTVRASEQHVAVPAGRVEIEGTLVKVEWRASAYGDQLKAIVKVETPAGTWLAWGTVPSAMIDEAAKLLPGSAADALRGARVRFTATVEAGGREAHFGFFKRPTKPVLLSTPAVPAA